MLRQLDAGRVALKWPLRPVWAQTAVLVMTEISRTTRVNGTKGTDHGTATVAFVLDGAALGRGVIADPPGLGDGRLFENRDHAPTADLRVVAKGVLAQHLRLENMALVPTFPGEERVAPMRGRSGRKPGDWQDALPFHGALRNYRDH